MVIPMELLTSDPQCEHEHVGASADIVEDPHAITSEFSRDDVTIFPVLVKDLQSRKPRHIPVPNTVDTCYRMDWDPEGRGEPHDEPLPSEEKEIQAQKDDESSNWVRRIDTRLNPVIRTECPMLGKGFLVFRLPAIIPDPEKDDVQKPLLNWAVRIIY